MIFQHWQWGERENSCSVPALLSGIVASVKQLHFQHKQFDLYIYLQKILCVFASSISEILIGLVNNIISILGGL